MRTRYILFVPLVWIFGCASPKSVFRIDTSDGGVNLQIPDVAWDPKKADLEAGWCGEASIQMVLAYYGKNVPQDVIHQAGSPSHSDLEDDDMDTALKNIGALFHRYSEKTNDPEMFFSWIRKEVHAGHPVICGCKIYPTEHSDWDLDHFVVITGYNSKGLLLNTQLDCDGQVLVTYRQLTSMKSGYSFSNRSNRYWARSITGIRHNKLNSNVMR